MEYIYLNHLHLIQHIMRLISEKNKVDLSKPYVLPKGLEPYRYENLYNFREMDEIE